jgi:hypothetical protein
MVVLKLVMIFGCMGAARATKNHDLNTTIPLINYITKTFESLGYY